jgi:glycosyltransferase involved in cell wall biosynthesis
MVITFVLHSHSALPGGGPLVVYRYANELTRRGHNVYVINPCIISIKKNLSFKNKVKYYARKIGIKGGYKPGKWLKVNDGVVIKWVPTLNPKYIPKSDVIVATYWKTADIINSYSSKNVKKIYLIQGEDYVCENDIYSQVINTWKMKYHKIAISRMLIKLLNNIGESAYYIPNGVEHDVFSVDVPIEDRNPKNILMMFHVLGIKGTEDGLEAISIIKKKHPEINVSLFSIFECPHNIPKWISFYKNPSRIFLRELYNKSAIFISSSLSEGWNLTACEAANCGAALCVTDIGGHREFTIPGKTALLSAPGDPSAMASNIERLINNNKLRIELANEQIKHLKSFTWERSADLFETYITRVT